MSLGVLFALSRDDAKRLFGARTDEAVLAFVESIKEDAERFDSDRTCQLDKAWDAIHRCLSDGTLDPAAGQPPLNQAILGGRPMLKASDELAIVVRPDVVGHVAHALREISVDWLQERYNALANTDYSGPHNDDDFLCTWDNFQDMRKFYETAAARGEAMLFTA